MGVRVWLDLERLMLLPLDAVARGTLWRELLHLITAAGDADGRHPLRDALELRLLGDELDRCRRLGQEEEWLEALQRLEALRPEIARWSTADAPAVLLELIVAVHRVTVIEERPMPGEARCELLWLTHRWLKPGVGIALPSHDWLLVMREQLCCVAAIAWLDRVRSLEDPDARAAALRCSHALLVDLAAWMTPCPDWISPNLLAGLRSACEPANRPFHPLVERVGWAQHLARLAPETAERERLDGLLGPALAALEVGRALRLPSFPSSSAWP